MFLTQMILLLVIIYFGIRFGGVALGLLGGLGVTILVFAFGVVPGKPPVDVMLIILAVVTTSATLEATGALNLIVRIAEKALRKNPKYVTYLAPISTFSLTMLVGTGHAVYPLLPVIYDVSYRQGIRPERPMAMASVAAQLGITASPIAAAAAAVIGIAAKNNAHIGLIDILRVTIPAGVIGMLLAATWSLTRGKDLDKDPEFQAKLLDPEMKKYMEGGMATTLNDKITKEAKTSLIVFLIAIGAIVVLALFPGLLPKDNGKPLSMSIVIQFVMFAAGAIILFLTKVKPKAISDSKVFNAGMIAVIMIFGIAWMSDTVIEGNKTTIISMISSVVKTHPWTFALAMFSFSAFLKSQAATLTVMLPLGFALGVPVPVIIGCIPASYAYFFFCFYPSDLAAINFDRTGTTHIGKYILNHSFMIPGLIAVGSSTVIAYILSNYVF
ncbi:MAG TPA: anaerobic C4-dicarboxylate transporter [Chitinophagaceae bacterium]|nr:anaerobic C4-dicarboxylate transporter [Chitinophagaceae bacterium]